MYETIISERRAGNQGWIILNRPERRNSISPKMTFELIDAFRKYDEDDDIKVVILTGAGDKSFCAGGDLAPDSSGPQAFLDRYESSRKFAELFRIFENYRKPIIGRINGDALGGGFGLAVACDITIVVETARMGTPEINIGLFPYIIMATLMRNTSNPKKLLELMLTGERISAKEAEQYGFVNYIVSPEQLDQKVDEVIQKLISKSPAILRMGRRAYYTARELEFSKSLEMLSSMLSLNMMAEDLIEGVSAFFQKRKPEWKGR